MDNDFSYSSSQTSKSIDETLYAQVSDDSFVRLEELCRNETENENLIDVQKVPQLDDTLSEINFILGLGNKLKIEGKLNIPETRYTDLLKFDCEVSGCTHKADDKQCDEDTDIETLEISDFYDEKSINEAIVIDDDSDIEEIDYLTEHFESENDADVESIGCDSDESTLEDTKNLSDSEESSFSEVESIDDSIEDSIIEIID